jgi:hypothetical protein
VGDLATHLLHRRSERLLLVAEIREEGPQFRVAAGVASDPLGDAADLEACLAEVAEVVLPAASVDCQPPYHLLSISWAVGR